MFLAESSMTMSHGFSFGYMKLLTSEHFLPIMFLPMGQPHTCNFSFNDAIFEYS